MPHFENIPAGADPPAEESIEDLEAALESWQGRVADLRSQRAEVRQSTPKAGLLAALAATDDDYAEAIAETGRLSRRIARLRRRSAGQAERPRREKVKAASEKGSGKGGDH